MPSPPDPLTLLIPWTDIPCVACCLIPDELCYSITCCGQTTHGRMRRDFAGGHFNNWLPCAADGPGSLFLTCGGTDGTLTWLASACSGNGTGTVPLSGYTLCPFAVTIPGPVGTVQCGPGDVRQIDEITIGPVGSCPACDPYTGPYTISLTKTVTTEAHTCCKVCPCCGLVPGRDKLRITLEAFGCDFDGLAVELTALVNECVWHGTYDSDYDNCPLLDVTATCGGNGTWTVTIKTAALDCAAGTDGVTFTVHACPDPPRFTDPHHCLAT